MDGLEEELETLRLEIPTKVSAFENDVPYLTEAKAENLYQPKGNYVEGVRVNNGNINYPTSGIVNLNIETPSIDAYTKSEVDERFQPKGNYITGSLKTINSESLLGSGDISLVKSVTIDEITKTAVNGNVSFTLGDKYNLFDLVYRNGHLFKVINGVETDLGEFGASSEGDGVGIDDIKFELQNGQLKYQVSIDGVWEDV